jgi:hypothetical protein
MVRIHHMAEQPNRLVGVGLPVCREDIRNRLVVVMTKFIEFLKEISDRIHMKKGLLSVGIACKRIIKPVGL